MPWHRKYSCAVPEEDRELVRRIAAAADVCDEQVALQARILVDSLGDWLVQG